MKKPTFFGERIYPVIFMMLITVVFISAIAGIHLATQGIVAENETIFLKKAVLISLGIAVPEDNEQINTIYRSSITEYAVDGKPAVFLYNKDSTGGAQGYSFRLMGPGLWGEIEALVGFDGNLAAITGIDFIKQNETPGLGARIEEPWFKTQFRGKTPPFVLVDEGTENNAPDEIDSITGATYTSRYVRDMVNAGPQRAAAMLKEVR